MARTSTPPMPPEKRLFRGVLWAISLLTLLNLLLTASLVGLIGGILILVMVWGIRRGDYPLSRALGIFLFLYAGVNLVVLCTVVFSGAAAHVSALIWLGLYSLSLILLGLLLRGKTVQTYLKTAQPPKGKEQKIHFFRGGWRDL